MTDKPAETMLEKAARSVYESYGWETEWSDVAPSVRLVAVGVAKAALEAIREPSRYIRSILGSEADDGWSDAIDAILNEEA